VLVPHSGGVVVDEDLIVAALADVALAYSKESFTFTPFASSQKRASNCFDLRTESRMSWRVTLLLCMTSVQIAD